MYSCPSCDVELNPPRISKVGSYPCPQCGALVSDDFSYVEPYDLYVLNGIVLYPYELKCFKYDCGNSDIEFHYSDRAFQT